MTDVFISYAREDRARVRPLAEGLQAEGWDVWWDPSEPQHAGGETTDARLASAGAVLVVWSAFSRGSEYVRAEAATGLYKNKLIQTRIDSAAPPRPFDQVELLDMTAWSGERDDPNWRRMVQAVRLYAGLPGSERPQVTRRATSTPAYIEPKRQIAVAPLIGVAVLAALGAGVWLLDPMGMRSDKAEAGQASASEAAVAAPAPSPEAESDWAQIDRNDPTSLRAYLTAHPQSTGAESARSLLRVLDAQAWVEAVTADTEDAYTAYLRDFPASAATPGAMADAANDRLESLGNERSQAVGDIQRGLAALKLYSGQVDGKPNDALVKAMATYAARKKQSAPSLTEAAPRDLRAFADVLAASGASASAKSEAAAKAAEAAAEADARRVEAAEAARVEARRDAPPVAASSSPAASGQSAPDRAADDEAWKTAQAAGTIASYQAYIAAQPEGLRVFEAKTQIARLSRPAPYSPQLVAAGLRPALETARRAQATAVTHAASAREMAKRADDAAALARAGAGDARTVTAADGTRYEAEIVDGKPNGVGVRISGAVATRGDRYRGQLRNGLGAGPGVYEFADNPNNAQAGALRYEGDHAGDFPTGYGVTTWKNGDVFAAQITDAAGASTGVLTFANGQRYEGQMVNGVRQGLGVVWSATGEPLLAGRWERGELVEPMAAPVTAP